MSTKLKERISKELIKNGIANGTIILDKPADDDQLVAWIGDYWFYYLDEEYDSIEDLRKNKTQDEIVTLIWEAINDEPINDEDEEHASECLYYRAVLLENNC